jgi:hypothetical protein
MWKPVSDREEDYHYFLIYPTINVEACLWQKPSYVESISHILVYLQHFLE